MKWTEFKFTRDEECVEAEMSNPIVLWNWPYSNNSGKQCYIVIDGCFTCCAGTNGEIELLSYRTRIGYFKSKKPSEPCIVTPIDGYHFDMDIITQRAHPVFHVQRDATVLMDKLERIDLTIDGSPTEPAHRHVRLPTPQIDLVSALIMVIADHIVCDEETENGFFNLAHKARTLIPLKANLERQAQLERCISQQEMLLDHWYTPMGA